jgi:uncharacterized protein (TIGR04222 family)
VDPNPFELAGPEFLGLYVLFLVLTVVVATVLRRSLREPTNGEEEPPRPLDPYEVAYLAGKGPLAVNAALAKLVHLNLLTVSAAERKVTAQGTLPENAHPLEKVVHAEAHPELGQSIKDVRQRTEEVLEEIDQRLKDWGLVVSDGKSVVARLAPTLLVLGVAIFGGIKLLVGLSRGKPVGFLVVLCIVTVLIALIGFARRPHRSGRGDRLLTRLKREHAALQHAARVPAPDLAAEDLTLALGLFGLSVLMGGPLNDLRTALTPPPGSASGCGGGGTCGGGGGCGGGGCGGGGCGGCGGG